MSSEQTGIVDPLILENPADKPDRLERNQEERRPFLRELSQGSMTFATACSVGASMGNRPFSSPTWERNLARAMIAKRESDLVQLVSVPRTEKRTRWRHVRVGT